MHTIIYVLVIDTIYMCYSQFSCISLFGHCLHSLTVAKDASTRHDFFNQIMC